MPDQPTKQALRSEIATRRRARPPDDRAAAADALAARVLALPELVGALTVAGYDSYPSEPGTGPLRAALRARGIRVLLPVLRADNDLDWVRDDRPGPAPVPDLGPDAVLAADLVVCPAVAATVAGARLGRGGGSYDRVLGRLRPPTAVVALLHDDEVVEVVPVEPHDRGVDIVVTPTRTIRGGRGALE